MADKFRFRDTDTIGVADAESDAAFLEECFVDNGLVDLLADCRDHRRIVLGRTGAGKTALLSHLQELHTGAITINPESLALAYISNSDILQFVMRLGVNLDIFFRLLWRHVFTVEIIKTHFKVASTSGRESILGWIRSQFSEKQQRHEKALRYLEKWGSKFWEQTDFRVTEVTTKLENDLRDSIGLAVPHLKFDVSDEQKISQEQKAQIVHRATSVINAVQIQELSFVLDMLDDILDDPQKPYFLVIDKLDENWVEERVRYLLIRALIETSRDFFKVRNAKIILCLRYDLVNRVMQATRSAGFQEEKYESLYLDLMWTPQQLTELLDNRINKMVRQRYTTQRVTHRDLLPKYIDKTSTIDYMLNRTLLRPRDIIIFFNTCIRQAGGNPMISAEMIKTAEGEYSRSRLFSIADEWSADYPELLLFIGLIKGKRDTIDLEELSDENCLDLAITLLSSVSVKSSDLQAAMRSAELNNEFRALRHYVAIALYRVGIVGLKVAPTDPITWSTGGRRSISIAEITDDTRLHVHPCFWRSLGIRPHRSTV